MTLPLFDRAPLDAAAKPPPTMRTYQSRGIIELRARILFGMRRILAIAPTGAGKMVLVAAITRMATVPMIFVAHRMELIDQCAEQLARFGLTNIGVIRADDERYNPSASVQVCSIQTLSRRPNSLPFVDLKATAERPYPVIIFIDEAHRAASESYLNLLDKYPMAIVIGLTATPVRLDGRALGDLFEDMVQIATYTELLKRPDWLVAPDAFSSEPIDLSAVHIVGSDYDNDELASVMHTDRLEGKVVEHWIQRTHQHPVFQNGVRIPRQFTEGERRRTLVFAVNVSHSMSLAARFEKELGPGKVAHLDGNTPENERKAMIRDLGAGKLQVVCNCNVAVEGVDVPEVKCVVSARPTQSLTMWRQQVGREMRPWNNVVPLLLDHGGNWDRLFCPWEDFHWSLTSRPSRMASKAPMKLCKGCYAYVENGRVTCPFCGYEFTAADSRIPTETSAQLVERISEPDALRLDFFNRQLIVAKTKGFKAGYASALYKERYGEWPPDQWSERAKLEFASDTRWQDAAARRAERKARRDAQDAAEKAALEAPSNAAPAPPEQPAPAPKDNEAMARVREQFKYRTELGVSETEYRREMSGPDQEQADELTRQLEGTVSAIGVSDGESFSDWLNDQGITSEGDHD